MKYFTVLTTILVVFRVLSSNVLAKEFGFGDAPSFGKTHGSFEFGPPDRSIEDFSPFKGNRGKKPDPFDFSSPGDFNPSSKQDYPFAMSTRRGGRQGAKSDSFDFDSPSRGNDDFFSKPSGRYHGNGDDFDPFGDKSSRFGRKSSSFNFPRKQRSYVRDDIRKYPVMKIFAELTHRRFDTEDFEIYKTFLKNLVALRRKVAKHVSEGSSGQC